MTTAVGDVPPGMHRVRLVAPDDPRAAVWSKAYGVEIDGRPVHVQLLTVRLEPGSTPVVTLEIPAILENAEILATLDVSLNAATPDGAPSLFEEC